MKNTSIVYIVIGILILSVGAYFAIDKFSIASGSQFIMAPTFGYLRCDPLAEKSITKTFGSSVVRVSCSSDTQGQLLGMNNGCSITMVAPDDGNKLVERHYAYKIYKSGILPSEQTILGGFGGYDGEVKQLTLGKDDYVELAYGTTIFGSNLLSEGQQYIITGSPFGIYNYNSLSSTNGQLLPNARVGNCYLEDNYYRSRKIQYYSPDFDVLDNQNLNYESLNTPYGTFTYFKSFTPIAGFESKVELLDGVDVYCMDNAVYKIFQIKSNNVIYNIVNYEASGYIKAVACCNGDIKPGYVCEDHAWIKQTEAECDLSIGKFCPQSTYQPYGEQQYKRQKCISNQCVDDVIDVVCNDASDCLEGEVCVFASNPLENYCVEGGSGGTSPEPFQPKPVNLIVVMWSIIIGLAAAIITTIVLVKNKLIFGKRKNLWLTLVFVFVFIVFTLIGASITKGLITMFGGVV